MLLPVSSLSKLIFGSMIKNCVSFSHWKWYSLAIHLSCVMHCGQNRFLKCHYTVTSEEYCLIRAG